MIAARILPPLAVIAAFAIPALLLRPTTRVIAAVIAAHEAPQVIARAPTPTMTPREREVEGCFLEWDERYGGDVDMIVRVDIDPQGIVQAKAFGGPDSPSLNTCIEEAILRTQYPIGHTLSLDLHVHWIAKQLQISPNLIAPQTPLTVNDMQRKLEELQREHARLLRERDERRARAH